MKSPLPFERARVVIQDWFNDFCKFHGTPPIALQIREEGNPDTGSYEIKNPSNGRSTRIFNSTLSDYEDSGSVRIPGELKGEIWDSFQDL
jgi:hypothetical protein